MRTLYELNHHLDELWEQQGSIDPETFQDTWDALEGERHIKIGNYCDLYKSWLSLSSSIKEEIKILSDRAKLLESKAEGLKEFLKLQLATREEFENERHRLCWRKSTGLVIDDEQLVPPQYIKVKTSVDKRAITEDLKLLKEGESFTFAHLEKRLNLQIK